jgi:hypothetical protein
VFFCFYLVGRHYMLFYLRQVTGAIRIVLLQAIKAVVASQILDRLILILRPRFVFLELSDTPQVIVA